MASVIVIALGMTALAQDSMQHRTMHGGFARRTPRLITDVPQASTDGNPNTAQGPGPGPIGPGPGCNLLPAPPSVGASVGLSYFGPPPSASNPSLVGPVQLLKSGTVDAVHGTITLPLYQGTMSNGTPVWYILTDVDDAEVATTLGLNFSAKMTFMSNAARTANLDQNGNLDFDKVTLDSSPSRTATPRPLALDLPPLPS